LIKGGGTYLSTKGGIYLSALAEDMQNNYHRVEVKDEDRKKNLSLSLSSSGEISVENRGDRASSFFNIGRVNNPKVLTILQDKLGEIDGAQVESVSLSHSIDEMTGKIESETLTIQTSDGGKGKRMFEAEVDSGCEYMLWGITTWDKTHQGPDSVYKEIKIT